MVSFPMPCLGTLLSWMFSIQLASTCTNLYCQNRVPISSILPQLSKDAAIYDPADSEFSQLSVRWSSYSVPSFSYVFVPAIEHDIIVMVRSLSMHMIRGVVTCRNSSWITLPIITYHYSLEAAVTAGPNHLVRFKMESWRNFPARTMIPLIKQWPLVLPWKWELW